MTTDPIAPQTVLASRFNALAVQEAKAIHAARQANLSPAERDSDVSAPLAVAHRLAARDEAERTSAQLRADER